MFAFKLESLHKGLMMIILQMSSYSIKLIFKSIYKKKTITHIFIFIESFAVNISPKLLYIFFFLRVLIFNASTYYTHIQSLRTKKWQYKEREQ